ncbi:MAG: nucleotidyltransferase domain-containing protein [Candidatus Diapherotrites archaeon]|nr:nucleotidyltransferase domain-containing protein [Candidatus Diapherotrites archaeon]
MLKLFKSFAGFGVLELFLFHSLGTFNINEVGRETKLSVFSAKKYCDAFLKEGLLKVEDVGNQRRFSLNNNSPYTKELKKTFSLLWFKEREIEKIVSDKAHSFAIYGSFASGEFDENSDLDLLVIGLKEEIDNLQLSKFRKEIKREVQLVCYDWVKWEKMKKEKHEFAQSILGKHILIKGGKL